MTIDKQNYIIEDNLTYAWGKALSLLLDRGVTEINPLFVTVKNISNNTPEEDVAIKYKLDCLLTKYDKYSCDTVANTIFPASLWNPKKPRNLLYKRYLNIISEVKKHDIVSNKYGIYFERFINYGHNKINQLEYIITTRKDNDNLRKSALQACVIDPNIDHTNQRQRGFPCLQQVCFTPTEGNKLSVTGFYPLQYIFERAYGNYLGLCRLGHFIAYELGLELGEMTCIASIAKLGSIKKTDNNLSELNYLINKKK